MRITAKVILDSLHPDEGVRLTTMELEYPRFIHAEFMTHRVFSRNASSSRAIPVERMIRMALEDPAFFVHLGANERGMQATEEIPQSAKLKFLEEWVELGQIVASYVERWAKPTAEGGLSLHKQVANRAMEPWHHIKVLVSSTYWSNFFKLRDHEDAQPEMRQLARVMQVAMMASTPKVRQIHAPYVQEVEWADRTAGDLLQASAARCARVSYWNHDGSPPNLAMDLQLFQRLCGSDPKHLSPLEHVASAVGRHASPIRSQSNFHWSWMQLGRVTNEEI